MPGSERKTVGHTALLLLVTVSLVVAPVSAAGGSAGAATGAADGQTSGTTGDATVDGGDGDSSTNVTNATGASASCSYRQTDTRIARDEDVSTAGVLDPHTDDDLLVLLGGFTDTSPTYTASDFEEAFFGSGSNVQGPGTLQDYYLETTDGLINLSSGPAGVSGWYETDMSSDQIYDEDGDILDLTPQDNSQFVRKVIEKADSDIDFSNYDNDGDGCIAIMVVYQGVDFRAHAAAPWGNFFNDADFTVDVDGVSVSAYARVQEMHDNGADRNAIGTPAHELGHLYGLPDLYEEDGNNDIGPWGLMASGNFGNRWAGQVKGSSPTHFSAWAKLNLLDNVQRGDYELQEYRATIPASGRPGILPPATQNQFYRIDPSNTDGCDACEDQYYLLGYRAYDGFDAGLRRWFGTGNSSLRISRIDGPWDGDMNNDPDLIQGVNRLNGFGNESFNDSTEPLATLADGRDSGIELTNFSEKYGMATFNDPPQRHLDPDETAVFAVAVSQTLPDGTETGDDWRVDHRVAIDGNANMSISLSTGMGYRPTSPYDDVEPSPVFVSGQDFIRTHESQDGLADGVVKEGAKAIHKTNQSTDYIMATTYPVFELPSSMSANVSDPWTDFEGDTSTVTLDVTLTESGDNYTYGQFGPPDPSQFEVSIGGVDVNQSNMTVTENAQHRYSVEAEVPVHRMDGYGVNLTFTGKKAGVEHTLEESGNILEPHLEAMSGDGSAADPYEISDMVDLQIADAARESHFELTADLDASESDDWFGGKGFIPIGETGEFPEGVNVTLQGNGHTIESLTMDHPDQHSIGLFSAIGPDGSVEDLTLTDPTVRGDGSGGGAVGTLAAHNRGTIDNVTVEGADVDENSDNAGTAGGLVGTNGQPLRGSAPETGTIRNVSVSGEVDGDGRVGGVLGINSYGGEIYDAHSSVRIDTGRDIGGLAGESLGPIVRSSATGDVESGGQYATGPVGGLVGKSEGDVRQSYATGNVSGNREAGGLVGRLDTNSAEEIATVSLSYATGDVDGEAKVGGLIGENNYGNITHSYAQGNVSGTRRVAGLVGANDDGYGAGFIQQSYATGRVSGDRFVEGLMYGRGTAVDSYWARDNIDREVDSFPTGQPVPREKMKGETAAENMTGFDFETTWTTVDGDYPQLQWYVDAQTADDPDDSDPDDTDPDDNDPDDNDPDDNDPDDNDTDDSDTNGGDSNSSDTDSDDSTPGGDNTTGASGPGLGVPVAVMAIVLASLALARRRKE